MPRVRGSTALPTQVRQNNVLRSWSKGCDTYMGVMRFRSQPKSDFEF